MDEYASKEHHADPRIDSQQRLRDITYIRLVYVNLAKDQLKEIQEENIVPSPLKLMKIG